MLVFNLDTFSILILFHEILFEGLPFNGLFDGLDLVEEWNMSLIVFLLVLVPASNLISRLKFNKSRFGSCGRTESAITLSFTYLSRPLWTVQPQSSGKGDRNRWNETKSVPQFGHLIGSSLHLTVGRVGGRVLQYISYYFFKLFVILDILQFVLTFD